MASVRASVSCKACAGDGALVRGRKAIHHLGGVIRQLSSFKGHETTISGLELVTETMANTLEELEKVINSQEARIKGLVEDSTRLREQLQQATTAAAAAAASSPPTAAPAPAPATPAASGRGTQETEAAPAPAPASMPTAAPASAPAAADVPPKPAVPAPVTAVDQNQTGDAAAGAEGAKTSRPDPVAAAMAVGAREEEATAPTTPQDGAKRRVPPSTQHPEGKGVGDGPSRPLRAKKRRREATAGEESGAEESGSEAEEEDSSSDYVGGDSDSDSEGEEEKVVVVAAAPKRKKQRAAVQISEEEAAVYARYRHARNLTAVLAKALPAYPTSVIASCVGGILDGFNHAHKVPRASKLAALFRTVIRPWRVRKFIIVAQQAGTPSERVECYYSIFAHLTRKPVEVCCFWGGEGGRPGMVVWVVSSYW
jgi:hypothetical protein